MSGNSEKYQLYYFNARGLGEPIRYILKLKNVPFDDTRVPLTKVPATIPPDVQKLCRFGQMPILKIGDNRILSQSRAIVRYLAKKYDLVGSDDMEATTCDELVDAMFDYWQMWIASFTAEGEDKKSALRKVALEKGRDRYLTPFNAILESRKEARGANNDDPVYLVRDGLTWADIYVANALDNIQKVFKIDLLSEFPLLEALLKNVFGTPAIKEYIRERPVTEF